ncbi:hypothetical protein SUBVAR_06920 [Subdoligranulum variabile DSM 15176]|uniref:Uncharacterized protein n=1 Tax=Subdoligranulum variabile DSM 15176 TaxID=411471 RepID=D1PR92_9FIRM|nr:hypothetical protein SUBVAR_06920 [Subdoligranulum variabile DSM 15176]
MKKSVKFFSFRGYGPRAGEAEPGQDQRLPRRKAGAPGPPERNKQKNGLTFL